MFISGDSILYAVHRSYDEILKQLEMSSLAPDAEDVARRHARALAAGALAPLGGDDARRTLTSTWPSRSGCSTAPRRRRWRARPPPRSASLLAKAKAAIAARRDVELFGVDRDEDFSQFKPRGHYTETRRAAVVLPAR